MKYSETHGVARTIVGAIRGTVEVTYLWCIVGVAFILFAACGGGSKEGVHAGVNPPQGTADLSAPVLAIITPVPSGTYQSASAQLTLTGRASDNVGVTQVSWSNNRGGTGTATLGGASTAATWSTPPIALQTGANTLSVTARDAAGNVASNAIVVFYGSTSARVYFISPTGSNTADCLSMTTPGKSFAYVFSKMAAGDELILLDGTYSAAAGTGSMHWDDGPD